MYTLNSTEVHAVAYAIDKAITTGANCTAGGDCCHLEYSPPLTTDRPHAVVYAVDSYNQTMEKETIYPLRSAEGGDTKPMVLIHERTDSISIKPKPSDDNR